MRWTQLHIATYKCFWPRRLCVLLTAIALSSCIQPGFPKDAKIRLEEPAKVVALSPDSTFEGNLDQILQCLDIQIVSDTILILESQTSASDLYIFKAYSLDTFQYLGSIIPEGRGPGEMLSPHIAKGSPDGQYLCVNDNAVGKAYLVDVLSSIDEGNTVVCSEVELPSNTIDWAPLEENKHFCLRMSDNEFVYQINDKYGADLKTITPYDGISGENNVTYLSSAMAVNREKGLVALGMVCLPQLLIVRTDDESIISTAVDKAYRNWKQIFSTAFSMDTKQYFSEIACTNEYIFASYLDCSLESVLNGGHGTTICVFDWDGHFLQKLMIKEDISALAVSGNVDYLYCIDKIDGKILRYGLKVLDTF